MNKFYSRLKNWKYFLNKSDECNFSPPYWRINCTNKFGFAILLLSLLLSTGFGFAQSSINYAFTTNTTGSLALDANGNAVGMTSGSTQLVGSLSDTTASAVNNFGFNYYFMGNLYTQFSANADGILGLGASAVSGTSVSGGSATTPKISALGGDLYVSASGKVHYKIIGTAPNRCLVVEWTGMAVSYNTTAVAVAQRFQKTNFSK